MLEQAELVCQACGSHGLSFDWSAPPSVICGCVHVCMVHVCAWCMCAWCMCACVHGVCVCGCMCVCGYVSPYIQPNTMAK